MSRAHSEQLRALGIPRSQPRHCPRCRPWLARGTTSSSRSINYIVDQLQKFIKIHYCRTSGRLPDLRVMKGTVGVGLVSGSSCASNEMTPYGATMSHRQHYTTGPLHTTSHRQHCTTPHTQAHCTHRQHQHHRSTCSSSPPSSRCCARRSARSLTKIAPDRADEMVLMSHQ